MSKESLNLCFYNLGCDISDKSIIDKCVQFCHVYNIDEEKFLELWVAYTITHSLDINPTINNLIQFEDEELKKNNECVVTQTISNIHTLDIQPKEDIINNVLELYNTGECSTSKSPTKDTLLWRGMLDSFLLVEKG